MGYTDAFSDVAQVYAGSRPAYPQPLFETLATLAPARHCAWDCGTGSGQAALGLAPHFDRVEATDPAAALIAAAPATPGVRFTVAPAEASGLADASVDLVSVAQALHWFDRTRFYAEIRRVARPGAIVAFYGYSWFYVTPAIDVLIDRWLLRPIETCWPPANRLLWDGYATVEFPFEELRAPRLAIHVTWSVERLFDYVLTWSAVRRRIATTGREFFDTARRELQAAWGEPGQARHVVMPLAIRIGRLR